MIADDLIKNLARLEKYRTSLYLSTEKIEHWYLQKVSQIMEVGTGQALSGKIEAGILGFFKSEAGGEKSTESKVAIDNVIVQGVVAENSARASGTLIDLSSTKPEKGELLYYLGAARITMMGGTISPETTGLSSNECVTVEAVRNAQEGILKAFDAVAGTIVLTFTAKGRAFASIGSLKRVDPNRLASYHAQEKFGILCTLESTRDGVVFLDPLWIWNE